ncbi:MAG: type II secretion system GspH family protein [Puniceicoccales bacterium]|jgi:prepilin-type N-terminal cleavage/methylation domain-containing protein|nr:type II secretion system GspH family protein [Puniceicoccales bacterium]
MSKKNGFTLVELIVVISIIGVLMAFVLPSIGGVLERSRRANAQNCIKQLANAYLIYREDKGDFYDEHGPLTYISGFAEMLAKEGLLNDPNCYVFSSDAQARAVNKPSKDTIVHADGQSPTYCFWNSVFSINIVINLSDSCPPNTTPIIYTRGLNGDGMWDESNGVFGKKGGFIAFLDGQVKWFDNVSGKLMRADMTAATSDIREAIPSDAVVLDARTGYY